VRRKPTPGHKQLFNALQSPPQPAGLRNRDNAAFSPLKKLATLVIFNHAIGVNGEKEASYPVTGRKGKVGASFGLDSKNVGWCG